jgi:hypothetical protein
MDYLASFCIDGHHSLELFGVYCITSLVYQGFDLVSKQVHSRIPNFNPFSLGACEFLFPTSPGSGHLSGTGSSGISYAHVDLYRSDFGLVYHTQFSWVIGFIAIFSLEIDFAEYPFTGSCFRFLVCAHTTSALCHRISFLFCRGFLLDALTRLEKIVLNFTVIDCTLIGYGQFLNNFDESD